MPRRSRKTELCPVHFPHGLHDQPKDATQVSCEHGAWDVEQPEREDPPVTKTGQGDGGDGGDGGDNAKGDASGQGDKGDNSGGDTSRGDA